MKEVMSALTPVGVFEELRFVWELYAAELILLFPFAKAKTGLAGRITVCAAVLGVCAQFYFIVLGLAGYVPGVLQKWVVVSWYLLLVLLSLLLSKYCFFVTFSDAAYIVISGYTAQHMIYVIAHEVLAKGVWKDLSRWLFLYIGVSVLVCCILYFVIYLVFSRALALCEGTIVRNSAKGKATEFFVLVVLMVSTFTCQHIFESSDKLRYYAALVDCLLCILILSNQYNICKVYLDAKEKAVLEQMQSDSARFYTISKELIETVNRKSHDMKHILNALERADGAEKQQFIDETRRDIEAYRRMVQTDYEELNTVLAERTVYCENRGIRLDCVAGDVPDGFMRAQDLYVLLGNAVDNAVESVMKLADERKRVITVNVGRSGAFVSIQVCNYYEGNLQIRDGLPLTSKKGKYSHGFGLKSVRLIAENYGGDISIDTEDGIFTLQIMIPAG